MFHFENRVHAKPFRSSRFPRAVSAATVGISLLMALTLCQGCSSYSGRVAASTTSSTVTPSTPAQLSLLPSSTTLAVGQQSQFSMTGGSGATDCVWQSSSSSVLASIGNGEFQGQQPGNATVSVSCGSQSAQASAVVVAAGPIRITTGGTYSGAWNSNDPATPAITIATDKPVTLQNSVISGRGDLISISGDSTGANVTIDNVTGTALDPLVAGMQRGKFVNATNTASLTVQNTTIYGASFGIVVAGPQIKTLKILNNLASNLEDRESDGSGGLLSVRPDLGHFVLLYELSAPAGAEIAWNQIVQVIGKSSTEDVINIYGSQGSAGHPIWVHDNYMEGYSSTTTTSYTGNGAISDGYNGGPATAFVTFQANEMVHTAGGGVAIAYGHDITATGNRVVSCGIDSTGAWFAMPYANAAYIWDSYGTGAQFFYNNTVSGTAGGLIRPDPNDKPMIADLWVNGPDATDPGVSSAGNAFTNPCVSGGSVNIQAEAAERAYWAAKAAAANELIGDQHSTS